VHTAGGFINPGWKGHMPLTLYNHSPVTLKIPVGTPVCQLLVIPLAEAPDADYAQRGDGKYLNDNGGPSLWWRDDTMRKVRENFARVNLDSHAFDELEDLLQDEPDEGVLSRLEDYLATQGNRRFGNADELLRDFSKKEKWGRRRTKWALNVARGAWGVVAAWMLSFVFVSKVSTLTWVIAGVLMAAAVLAGAWGAVTRTPFYFTPDQLTRAGQRRDQRVAASEPTKSQDTR
jgi:hypothetical protein